MAAGQRVHCLHVLKDVAGLPVRSSRPVVDRSEIVHCVHALNGAFGLATCSLDQASERQAREYIAYTCAEWRLVGYMSALEGYWSTGQRVHYVQVFKKPGWVTCPLEEAGGRHKDAGADHCADNQ